jgi:hypothetical protein
VDKDMPEKPLVDPENFNADHIDRTFNIMPKQGDKNSWGPTQDYCRAADPRRTAPFHTPKKIGFFLKVPLLAQKSD